MSDHGAGRPILKGVRIVLDLTASTPYHVSETLPVRVLHGTKGTAVVNFATRNGVITGTGLRELCTQLDRLARDVEIQGVILTDVNEKRPGKGLLSFPGVDIVREFLPIFKEMDEGNTQPMRDLLNDGQKAVLKIAKFPKPFCGVVRGVTLGGGVELMSFTYCLMAEDASLALPECGLNVPEFLKNAAKKSGTTLKLRDDIEEPCCLFPGWHGLRSVLYRMLERKKVSRAEAIEANDKFVFDGLDGKVDSGTALKYGFVDAVLPVTELLDAANLYIESSVDFKPRVLMPWDDPPVRAHEPTGERETVGRRHCDDALYNGTGTWDFLGNRDSLLMLKAMLEGLRATALPAYAEIISELKALQS